MAAPSAVLVMVGPRATAGRRKARHRAVVNLPVAGDALVRRTGCAVQRYTQNPL